MSRKALLVCLVGMLIVVFSFGNAMAFDPNWKANQQKLFDQIPVKVGDVIDSSNWQKVEGLLPPSVLDWVKKGEFVLNIGEFKYDFSSDETWDKATQANKGKYKLGPIKEIIEVATGKYPTYINGRPFPDVDLKNDPDAGAKLMHNNALEQLRMGAMSEDFNVEWIGESRGLEREISSWWYQYAFLTRPDGKELPNPMKTSRIEIITMTAPYDIAGNVLLKHHWLDGSEQRFVMYIPAIRRVKKMSAANHSDPFFGTDLTNDDAAGWNATNTSAKWRLLEEKIILLPKAYYVAEHPDQFVEQSDGSWKAAPGIGNMKWGYADPEWKGAKWAPLHAVWIPRKVYVIEAIPVDPYYNYGRFHLYVDKESMTTSYNMIFNRADEYWKTILVDSTCVKWRKDNQKIFTLYPWYVAVDDKTHHASICSSRGKTPKGREFNITFDSPQNTPSMYRDDKIATMAK